MSQSFEVVSVGESREWESQKHNQRYYAYPVDLRDGAGKVHMAVEWSRKLDSDAPKVGDTIIGDIKGGQYGDKLAVDWDAMKEQGGGGWERKRLAELGGSSGGSRSGPRTFKPESQFDPEKVARITRSHAQKVAVDLLTANPGFNKSERETKKKALAEWADFFEMDVEEASKAASVVGPGHAPATEQAQGDVGGGGPDQPPAAAPSAAPEEEEIPF